MSHECAFCKVVEKGFGFFSITFLMTQIFKKQIFVMEITHFLSSKLDISKKTLSIINLHHNLQLDKGFSRKEFFSFLLQALPKIKALLEKKRKPRTV